MLPISDQQEGGERRKLPKHQQKQDVVAEDDADHRPLEEEEIGKEFPHIVTARQIMASVGYDQKADAQDQAREEEPKRIKHQGKVQAQQRHPVDANLYNLTGKYRRRIGHQADEGGQRDSECHPCAGLPASGIHQTG